MRRIKQILIICLGNTARSPAAEYLAKDYSKKMNLDVIIESAGFMNAFSNMQPESREYLDSKGIDHSDFRPQIINRRLLEKQDLILTMENTHKEEILQNYGNIEELEEKIYTLREFNGESKNLDIIDPYYTSNETYHTVMKLIDKNIKEAIQKIIQINDSF
ncbi:MAG: arsenate reductase/protein-tyrosine-phosphatase family protein [Promethearchaeota archaeon]